MNYALVEHSPRLQRVIKLLESGKTYTTLDIVKKARVCAVNSAIAELRCNGYKIECQAKTVSKGRIWTYRMER